MTDAGPTMRRSQEDRRTGTRRALLDATVECLVEYGYANTTTRMVADRAGVSRGAQTHHYPTKHELVVAAIEHLFDGHAREFARAFAQVPPQQRSLERAIDALWQIVSGPTYAAILEVVVASRTDDELRAVVHGVAASLEQTIVDLVVELFPDIDDLDVARRAVEVALTVVQGAAVSRYGGFGDPDAVIEFAKSVAGLVVPTPRNRR